MSQARRRIGRNFFWKSAAEGSKALQALYFVLLARHLGASELGRFSVGFSAAMLLASVGDFGLNTLLTRHVAVHRPQGSTVFLQTAYLKAAFFATLLGVAACWPGLGPRRTFVLLFLGIAAGRNLIDQLSYLCLAYENLVIEAKMKFLLGLAGLTSAWLTLALRPSVNAAAAALLAAHVLAAIVGAALVARRTACLPSLSSWPPLAWPVSDVREILPMTLIGVSLAGFSRIDISCLKGFGVPAAAIGNYFAAERIIAASCLLPGFLAIASLPVFSRPEDAGHWATIRRLRRELLLAGCLAGLTLNAWGRPLIALIYGGAFHEAGRPLAWLGLALPFMFVNHFSLIALIADKRSWRAAAAAAAAFSLNVTLDLLLIPRLGILGAALGAVGAQATLSLLVWSLLAERPFWSLLRPSP